MSLLIKLEDICSHRHCEAVFQAEAICLDCFATLVITKLGVFTLEENEEGILMLFKNRFMLLVLLILLPLIGYANNTPSGDAPCIRLGATPSLIIKFKQVSSKDKPLLDTSFISSLTSDKATFTSARPMSGGAYIVFFKPTKSMLSEQLNPGCYAPSAVDALTRELKAKGNIEYADPNSLLSVTEVRSRLPVYDPTQWDMLAPPGGIDAETALITTMGSPKAITAVLDTGILNNDSLNPNVLSGVTFNNNGATPPVIGATPSCDSSCATYDHGTHVAGTVAASGTFAYGEFIYGVAPQSKVLPVNVFTKGTNTSDCGGPAPCLGSYVSDQIDALHWLAGTSFTGLPVAPLVTMVNMSLGGVGTCATARQSAINQLLALNIGFAIAAGNSNVNASNTTPANCTGVMAVAATDRNGYGAPYSNYGNVVSFAAPGGDESVNLADGIYSTIENAYGYKDGTSMASPHAAGLGALMYSLDPTLTPDTVKSIMQSTTTPFPSGGPGASCTVAKPCGTGILNAYQAIQAVIAQAPTLQWTPNITSVINSYSQVTVSWQPATWSPARTTGILYTVNLNGVDVTNCTLISTASCVLTNLVPDSINTVIISATDSRQITTPIISPAYAFQLVVTAPTLTFASRNPLIYKQAFLYYSDLGSPTPDSYQVNGVPLGVTMTLDAKHHRFVLDNLITLDQIDNVSVTSVFGSVLKQSNAISIPGVTPSAPTLTVADRNPLLPSTAFIYYSTLGGPPPDGYVINGLPSGAVLTLDVNEHRYVVANIRTPKQIDNVTISAAYGSVLTESNAIVIPNIL